MAARASRRAVAVAVAAALAVTGIVGSGGPGGAASGRAPAQVAPGEPDDQWVRAVYDDLLGRAPSPAQLDHRVGQLRSGMTRARVASHLAHSEEHTGRVVDRAFRRILGRPADAAGRAFWAGWLADGSGVGTMAARLYASPEVAARAGTTSGFVDLVYRNLLGRAPDTAGRAHWMARLGAGLPRADMAHALYRSTESGGLRIVLAYLDLLGRPAYVSERPYWAERLRTLDDLDLEALILGSVEYGRRSQFWELGRRVTALTPQHGGGRDPSVSGDGRFVAFASPLGSFVPGGPRRAPDVFVLDRLTGRYRALTAGNQGSGSAAVSADGSTVAFASAASNLVVGDTNGRIDIFVVALAGGPVRRLVAGDGHSLDPSLSADGRKVAFTSAATNLVPGGTDGTSEVYVATRGAGGAVASLERVGGDGPSDEPMISSDGSALVFRSEATDLGPVTEPGRSAFWTRLPMASSEVVALTTQAYEEEAYFRDDDGPSVSADGGVVTYLDKVGEVPGYGFDVLGGFVARIEGGQVADPVQVEVGEWVNRAFVSDGGTALLVDRTTLWGDVPSRGGVHLSAPGATPTPVGFNGDLSADGTTVVATHEVSAIGDFTGLYLYELG